MFPLLQRIHVSLCRAERHWTWTIACLVSTPKPKFVSSMIIVREQHVSYPLNIQWFVAFLHGRLFFWKIGTIPAITDAANWTDQANRSEGRGWLISNRNWFCSYYHPCELAEGRGCQPLGWLFFMLFCQLLWHSRGSRAWLFYGNLLQTSIFINLTMSFLSILQDHRQ